MGPMDVGETGYNRYNIDRCDHSCFRLDVSSHADSPWPASQWKGGGTNLCFRPLSETKSTTNPLQCWQHIAEPTVPTQRVDMENCVL